MSRILVVEDDPLSQKYFCAALEAHGHKVILVSGAAAALRRLERFSFDLMLTDLGLLGLGGGWLIDQVRASDRHYNVPIIVASAYVSAEARLSLTQRGVAAVLAKPVAVDDLIQAAVAAIQQRRSKR